MNPNLNIITAGAGSGKTYRLTEEMVKLLQGGVRASGIIATTFTKKAAAELQERVRVRLLEEGMTEQANDLTNALIGTVHGLGVKLLQRFAYEAGVSPEVSIIADEDQQILFNQSLSTVITNEKVDVMEELGNRLGLNKKGWDDWRKTVRQLTDVARANDFDKEVLEKSKILSFEKFQPFLGEISKRPLDWWNAKLKQNLEETIEALESNADQTKGTNTTIGILKGILRTLKLRGELYWHEWVKIAKIKVGAKSREDIIDLVDFAASHEQHPAFHKDIKSFIYNIFDIAIEGIKEYEAYKKKRGLIDYTDMEVLVKKLLKNEAVKEVLKEELDLLMVDEFQDTSPIQLEIFWQLSQFAKHSIWVGDPKQSIYGFRGADPKLMLALIDKQGGVKAENIQEFSWRSREDVVNTTNAIFVKAFSDVPVEQVALKARRLPKAKTGFSANKVDEPEEVGLALQHWHFEFDGGKRAPGKPWMENCIATSIKKMLDRGVLVYPKDTDEWKYAKPGDFAVLCRSNAACQEVADALHKAGLKAAISRAGLLSTPESKLILACLKFILNKYDSLSIAEILLLSGQLLLEEIIEDRIDYLSKKAVEEEKMKRWGDKNPFVQMLNKMRTDGTEFSSAEILNYLLEEGQLRRKIVAWGQVEQRLANVDALRSLSLKYEENCNRLHTAASLGGLLLWLYQLEADGKDNQGSGETPGTVRVMTYHKSKGLEFPITICHSLEATLRDRVYGINLVSEREDVDLDNILGHRWVRFWVNPYADQSKKTNLEERINASDIKLQATKDALAEDARVMYVGITRARDYLVIPTRANPTKWLNRVFHEGKEDVPTLDSTMDVSPFVWNDKILPIYQETFVYPRDFTTATIKEPAIFFPKETQKEENHYHPYKIDLNKEGFEGDYKRKIIGSANTYTTPLTVKDDVEKELIAKCFKAFLAADNLKYDPSEREKIVEGLTERFEIGEEIKASKMLTQSEAFYTYLKNIFKIQQVWRKYPVHLHHKGRFFETVIDLLIKTENGLIIIQHSGFVGEPKGWRNKAEKEMGDWFFLTKKAVQFIFEGENVQTFCHFAFGAGILEVEILG